MFIPFPAILISIASIINVADQVPKFDLRSICEGNEACVRGERQPAIKWRSNGRSSRQQSAPAASD